MRCLSQQFDGFLGLRGDPFVLRGEAMVLEEDHQRSERFRCERYASVGRNDPTTARSRRAVSAAFGLSSPRQTGRCLRHQNSGRRFSSVLEKRVIPSYLSTNNLGCVVNMRERGCDEAKRPSGASGAVVRIWTPPVRYRHRGASLPATFSQTRTFSQFMSRRPLKRHVTNGLH